MIKRTVLIIDDDRLIRTQLKDKLNRYFDEIIEADNGKAGLKIVNNNRIDVIFLDLNLPDMNGIDILKKVKKNNDHPEIIIITGYGAKDSPLQSLRHGAIDYIEKPINPNEIQTAIGRAEEKLLEKEKLTYRNTILLLDQDQNCIKSLKPVLEKNNYIVLIANNEKEGHDTITENKIDIIITCLKSHDTNGLNVIKKAKSLFPNIEGIILADETDGKTPIEALRAGVIDFFIKPVQISDLLSAMNRAIARINSKNYLLYRNREQEITSKIIYKMNEELEMRIKDRTKKLNEIQTQLFQTSKLATLGEMSAGLAHEINQPLSCIMFSVNNIEKLKKLKKLTENEFKSCIYDIKTSIDRVTKIIKHVRTFARQDLINFVELDINKTIKSSFNLIGQQLKLHEVKIIKKLSKDIPIIRGEPYQLEQVWINLIRNAMDSLDEKEKLLEKTPSAKFKKILSITTDYNSKSNTVKINFKDNGMGIPKKIINKVFDPFFTTKEVGKATGLGLSISYGIIKNHKGKIDIISKENKGTSITITLPVKQ